jgi:hypothetical protein
MRKEIISNALLYFSYLVVTGMGILACLAIGGLFINILNTILGE